MNKFLFLILLLSSSTCLSQNLLDNKPVYISYYGSFSYGYKDDSLKIVNSRFYNGSAIYSKMKDTSRNNIIEFYRYSDTEYICYIYTLNEELIATGMLIKSDIACCNGIPVVDNEGKIDTLMIRSGEWTEYMVEDTSGGRKYRSGLYKGNKKEGRWNYVNIDKNVYYRSETYNKGVLIKTNDTDSFYMSPF